MMWIKKLRGNSITMLFSFLKLKRFNGSNRFKILNIDAEQSKKLIFFCYRQKGTKTWNNFKKTMNTQ